MCLTALESRLPDASLSASSTDDAAQAFAARLMRAYNDAALTLMVSVGHRTGLFDALAGHEPDSHELAAVAGLDERYVREWLGAMVTSGVVRHDPSTRRYHLPPPHAACLTRAAGIGNLAIAAQLIPVLGQVEDPIVHCFREGGGVAYEQYARFHDVMAELSEHGTVAALFDAVLPLVDGAEARLRAGIDVADFGCGQGAALLAMAQRYPASRFTGFDLSPDTIRHARAEAARKGLANVRFQVRDLSDFGDTAPEAAFDLVFTFDAVHDQPRPRSLLRGIRRTLRPGGVYLMQEISGSSQVHENCDHPMGTYLYTVSCMHCMTVSLAQGGEGLGAMWGDGLARTLLAEAGFDAIDRHVLEHDVLNAYYVMRT